MRLEPLRRQLGPHAVELVERFPSLVSGNGSAINPAQPSVDLAEARSGAGDLLVDVGQACGCSRAAALVSHEFPKFPARDAQQRADAAAKRNEEHLAKKAEQERELEAAETTEATARAGKSAAELQAEYDALAAECTAMQRRIPKSRKAIEERIKAELKKEVGDFDALKAKKGRAFKAWQEKAQAEADGLESGEQQSEEQQPKS
jgi:hypothetical protein